MLESLKLFDRFLRSGSCWTRYGLTVLAVPIPDTHLENIYVEKFSKIFTPDVVVLLSHYLEGDNTFKDCRVVPPTLLTRPASLSTSSSYKYDLRMAAEAIRRLTSRGVESRLALSVTLKGRWTVLKAGQPADFLSECVYDPTTESFGSYTEVCEDSSFSAVIQYESGAYGALYYSQTDGRVFTYDNYTTFAEKICRVKLPEYTFRIGLIAYDVDYDDSTNVCDKINSRGAFNRTCVLASVTPYIEGFYDSEETCRSYQ
ncbi:hypothetical protein MTO96_017643 [Rhipicephalus appendiculatus]